MDALTVLMPLLLLLACPLLMMFMMRGMHRGGHGSRDQHRHHAGACEPERGQGRMAEDGMIARLRAMEHEIAALRRELVERDGGWDVQSMYGQRQ